VSTAVLTSTKNETIVVDSLVQGDDGRVYACRVYAGGAWLCDCSPQQRHPGHAIMGFAPLCDHLRAVADSLGVATASQ
jgi:hypothetical protein